MRTKAASPSSTPRETTSSARSGGAEPSAYTSLAEASGASAEALFVRLGSSAHGLTVRSASARLARVGANVVAREPRFAPLRRLLRQFASPLPLLLIGIALTAQLVGEHGGALVIAAIVALSVLFAWVQEFRSDRAAEHLRALVRATASVLRRDAESGEGRVHEIPIARVVPGDVVRLAAGDLVPADVRLLTAKDLFVDQATLTGESFPAEKHSGEHLGARPGDFDLPNIGLMGSHVVSGSTTALVLATGRSTRLGALSASLDAPPPPTSFDLGVRRFIALMLRFMLVMVPLVFLINGLTKGEWVEAFLFALAVAVGLTPEMLPVVVTVNLSRGALAMSRKKVIVKRLAAIQNLGAMDVLCTDKTGTLTQNRVVLERHVDIGGAESRHVLELAYLNSHFQSGLRNLLDVAVLEHAEMREHLHIPGSYGKVDEVPFDFRRRRMSVAVARKGGPATLICKGACEEIIAVCSHAERHGTAVPLAAPHRDELLPVIRGLNEEGFRVIAVAYKRLPASQRVCTSADETDLTLAGYVAFLDPPKEGARAALRAIRRYGVEVKVLTGDNEVVTRKLCSLVDIASSEIVLGADVEALDDARLAEIAVRTTVFAKLDPQQKARIVAALRRTGRVVGYLGDGINDGPALNAGDVGISVSTAADVAREAADIILLEKSLLVLRDGLLEGRRVFGNILKYVRMGASSSFGNMLSVVGASAFLPFLPMAPVQVLLNNLLYDVSQTAIAADEVDRDFIQRPRRWNIGNVGRTMLVFGPLSSLFDYATFAVLIAFFGAAEHPALFQSGWFVESVLSQSLIVYVLRTAGTPFRDGAAAKPLVVATLAVCTIALWLPFSVFAPLFGLVPPPAAFFAWLAAILTGYLLLTQLAKAALVRRFGLD